RNQVMAVSPAFALHKRNAAVQAARALDPHDLGVSTRSVVLPPGAREAEKARQDVYAAAEYAVNHPLVVGGAVVDGPLTYGGPVGQESPEEPAQRVNEDEQEKAVTDDQRLDDKTEWPRGRKRTRLKPSHP